ncbi:MAG TPA: nuclear transport factor 2 family protein [Mycobacterium sp.]|nr:nuclear transport factor 2 family protein [Mycobacterium sp.]
MTTPFDDPQAELAWMFLQCITEGADLDEYFELLSDDFTYWSILTRTSVDKEGLRQEVERRKDRLRITLDLIRCINEGETVVIEAQGDCITADGTHYDSPVAFIVDTRDGQIVSVREYTDTRFAAQVLG